jgi:metal-responsive CopG/Arc/MetJ family transcriptional regulator
MKSEPSPKIVRRSVALPYKLIEEVRTVAPPELRENLNRLVTVALQDFVTKRKKRSFEESMAQMAADPAIRAECAILAREFAIAEADGLKND